MIETSPNQKEDERCRPLLSVIVPVYKAEAYLPDCVESILHQTFRDLELLLVDDGSPDGCPALCDAYAARDARIRVWHGPNGGVGAARNRGLAMASGSYVSFVDSDDRLAPDAYEKLLRRAEASDAQVVWCDYAEFRAGQDEVWPFTSFAEGGDQAGTVASMLSYGLQSSPPWNWLLLDRQFVESHALRFPETYQIGEDFWFSLHVHALADRSARVPETLYFYNQGNDQSLTHIQGKETTPADLRFMDECRAFLEGMPIWPAVEKPFGWRMLLYKSRWVTRAATFCHYRDWQPDVNRFVGDNPLLRRNVKLLMHLLNARLTWPAAVLAWCWRIRRNSYGLRNGYDRISMKKFLRAMVPAGLWRSLRLRRILRRHDAVAAACRRLIAGTDLCEDAFVPEPLVSFDRPVLWQYWAQGWGQVPDVVARCAASVDTWASGYRIVRLSDENLGDYLRLPAFLAVRRPVMSRAHFSDLLRVMLLRTYGGLWLDATVLLTAPLPAAIRDAGFFVYRRRPDEPDQAYWEQTYAYYFGWHPRFRVNMLNSIMAARCDHPLLKALCRLTMEWWRTHAEAPDYFFMQIFFDVLLKETMPGCLPEPESDCRPHFLQQSLNDSSFRLMSRDEILKNIPLHKLTYKHE